MAALSETDILTLRRIDAEEPVGNNYIIRLELLGLVKDEASGPRLTISGRRALRDYKAPPVVLPPEREPRDRTTERRSGPFPSRFERTPATRPDKMAAISIG